MTPARRAGVLCAVGASLAFGVTIVAQRRLAAAGLPVTAVLGVRFGIAAALLLLSLAIRRRPLRPVPGERLRAALLGALGYAGEAGLFFVALRHGSAGAVALLFYAYPALVTLLELVTGRLAPTVRAFGVLALSTLGAGLVVAAGSSIDITARGAVFALLAAASFAVYLVTSARIVTRSPAPVIGAWVAAGASVALLTAGALGPGVAVPRDRLGLVALNGLATAVAFALLYAALQRLPATSTAVVMTLEAFAAVALGAVVLHERVAPLQLAGGVAIAAAAVLVAREVPPTAAP